MASLTDEQKQFLQGTNYGIATTLRADGSPHNTVVWVDLDGGLPSFNTALHRVKAKHIERDPRAALLVVDPTFYRWLAVDGRAELTTEDADAQIDRLAQRYDGTEYKGWTPDMVRVKVRIHPERVTAYGF
ncbi:MAG TPA: PPOX class F420-dependent oxidoreductase [Gaiellaceae bacterium]|nr:PPOX class F420-dependent oxidoreductase [Gaiellaceae bacterium]